MLAFILIGATLLIYLGLDGAYGAPFHLYSPSEYQAFFRLNAISASTLTIFVGLIASGLISRLGGEAQERV